MLNIFMVLPFIILSIINYRINNDILSPSFIWSSLWGIYVFLFYIFSNIKNIFYPISFNTYGIYFIGAFMFSIGGLIGDKFNIKKTYLKLKKNEKNEIEERKIEYYRKEYYMMLLTFFILLIFLPVYYKNIVNLSGTSLLDIKTFFYQVRRAELDLQGGQFSFIHNLVPLSIILSVYFYNIYKCNKQGKVLIYSIIGVAIIYQLLTGGRAGAVYMILSLIGVEIIREGKLKFKSFIKLVIPLTFVITFIAYFVGKSGVDKTKPFLQNIGAFYKDIITYLLGGMAAFDKAVMYPGLISSNGGVKRFFLQTAKSFGFNVYVPSLHMQFTSIGPGLVTNVYTIYSYYYIDYGLLGICFFMFLLGIISSFIYKKSKSGNNLYCAFYGFFVSGIILSVYSESFYTNLNFLIKAIIIISILEFFKRLRLSKYNTSCQYGGDGNFENSGIYRGN